ncbi:hypothetical protein P1X14_04310 [Sphingomonas sp. AOB5]|uniref:hypothetical protein n=1 Tax=Sphingomonas sp. AOB5 TaxID=3034017 RepID=UPI0023F66F9F|nr:hypothetical protein [Sphingomonas sp. AOB5]MDF7774460.1 hypothetical protein [Sphingomonas sp. AOB5]
MIELAALALIAGQTTPAYAEALRCDALTTIEAARLDVGSPDHAAVFDASVEWHMAVVRLVVLQQIASERYGQDLGAALDTARADLARGSAPVRDELAACIKTAPPIPR